MLEDIRNIPVRERALVVLREAIIKGRLKPGERLVEEALAEQFQVSRTPLREAIHKLELDGFITRLPSRGVIVADISVQEARELYDVRGYLDGFAARLTTERLTDIEIVKLNRIRENIYSANKSMNHNMLREKADEFHTFVRNACKHDVLIDHLNKLYPHLLRYRNIAALHQGRMTLSGEEHLTIIDFILARRSREAELAMKEHIFQVGLAISETINDFLAKGKI